MNTVLASCSLGTTRKLTINGVQQWSRCRYKLFIGDKDNKNNRAVINMNSTLMGSYLNEHLEGDDRCEATFGAEK